MRLETWPRMAVVGAGAVGGYFGGLLARAGAPVTFIGRPRFVDAVGRHGLRMETLQFREVLRVVATASPEGVRGADVVLFCVKTVDTDVTARAIVPFLDREARVLVMQNGVDGAQRFQIAAGHPARSAVVYVGASQPEPGVVRHEGRGDLVIDAAEDASAPLSGVFARAGIPCRVSDNMEGELWAKLVSNCALNALSALARVPYGPIAASESARQTVVWVVQEVMAVAQAAGVHVAGLDSPADGVEVALRIARQIPAAWSSTAQDLLGGRRTEIASLNGYVARRGAELGVSTPVNQTLSALMDLAERAPR